MQKFKLIVGPLVAILIFSITTPVSAASCSIEHSKFSSKYKSKFSRQSKTSGSFSKASAFFSKTIRAFRVAHRFASYKVDQQVVGKRLAEKELIGLALPDKVGISLSVANIMATRDGALQNAKIANLAARMVLGKIGETLGGKVGGKAMSAVAGLTDVTATAGAVYGMAFSDAFTNAMER